MLVIATVFLATEASKSRWRRSITVFMMKQSVVNFFFRFLRAFHRTYMESRIGVGWVDLRRRCKCCITRPATSWGCPKEHMGPQLEVWHVVRLDSGGFISWILPSQKDERCYPSLLYSKPVQYFGQKPSWPSRRSIAHERKKTRKEHGQISENQRS